MENTSVLPVMEAFYTIQGEGKYQGCAAYFIRLAGCDVGCVWCDVKESWNIEGHPVQSVEEIATQAAATGAKTVVVTGGEPLMHNLDTLTQALQSRGLRTHIETSGAYPISGHWNWICFSPKKFKKPLAAVALQADELKVVVYNQSDMKWAEEHAATVSDQCALFLQPEWSKSEKVLPTIIDYVKKHPNWEISLQIHKFMNIP